MHIYFDTEEFQSAFTYCGSDLGASYDCSRTQFRVWAPTAEQVELRIYQEGTGENLLQSVIMKKDIGGTWFLVVDEDLEGYYYTYAVTIDGATKEAVDPYAKSAGVNGLRGRITDLMKTNPPGFLTEKKPEFLHPTDGILYELHVRDVSSDENSGISETGKFLGLTESGTKSAEGLSTGLDHLKELGITHVHLLPVFDYASIDEARPELNQYNWGYDPLNYNLPEGSYSTDPYHGEVRIREFKKLIQVLHENGIRVIMDVVYNHTYSTDSNFNRIVPGYYYRMEDNKYTNGSGCGNETASERAMVRKYIVDSVIYWAKEYHIDGFRFDLMGVHDLTTMQEVEKALHSLDSSILIYGEGWTGGPSGLPMEQQAVKNQIYKIPGVAAFSDDMRDGIKGSVFISSEQGFVNGRKKMEEQIKFGVVAATNHPQVMYRKDWNPAGWAYEPDQCINYASCHDNLTLWDKLSCSNPEASFLERKKMNLLSAAILFTSQGIPFIQAGEELLRSKPSEQEENGPVENSYCSSDYTNAIRWKNKTVYHDVFLYYKGLIEFRKAHPALRLRTAKEIQERLTFYDESTENVVMFRIDNRKAADGREQMLVIYNANKYGVTIPLPEGTWNIHVNGETAGTKIIEQIQQQAILEPISAMVLVQN